MTDVETKSRALFSKSKPRLTPEEFEEKHLVPLKNFFLQMFGNSNYRITSSEYMELYGLVYEVCWDNEFSKKLFSELTFLARGCCHVWFSRLETISNEQFLQGFLEVTTGVMDSLKRICPIFLHMDKHFLTKTFKTNLKTEIMNILNQEVTDKYILKLLDLMVSTKSCQHHNAMKESLCKHLFILNPEYFDLKPKLFSMFLEDSFMSEVRSERPVNDCPQSRKKKMKKVKEKNVKTMFASENVFNYKGNLDIETILKDLDEINIETKSQKKKKKSSSLCNNNNDMKKPNKELINESDYNAIESKTANEVIFKEDNEPKVKVNNSDLCFNTDCDKPSKHRCSVCLQAAFCSKSCSIKFWPQHKLHCNSTNRKKLNSLSEVD